MTIVIHYFDPADQKIVSRAIATFAVKDNTDDTTGKMFEQHLKDYGLEAKVKIITTDNASNMTSHSNSWNG